MGKIDLSKIGQELPVQRKFTITPTSENCLSHWYPMIVNEVPTPETFFIRISDGWSLLNVFDGNECWFLDDLCNILTKAANRIGSPVFLRTGQGSGKHDWETMCYVSDISKMKKHILNLVSWSHMVDFRGLFHDVWVVREMLPTNPYFYCTGYGNMPVVREWRYFVDGEKLLYGVPYWPMEALAGGYPDDPEWQNLLGYLHDVPDESVEKLARAAGKAVGGKWSVDILETNNGWYVTDMAIAEHSYGWNPELINT